MNKNAKKEMTEEEVAKIVNAMDPEMFALAIFCERFWEWAQNPDKSIEKNTKAILAKKYKIKENCNLMMMMLAYIAGAEAAMDIAKQIITGDEATA